MDTIALFFCSLVHKFVIGFHFALFITIFFCSGYIKQLVRSSWRLPGREKERENVYGYKLRENTLCSGGKHELVAKRRKMCNCCRSWSLTL